MHVALVIPVFNRKDVTLRCLEALLKSHNEIFQIIVVDSGSTDGTQLAIREKFSGIKIIQTDSSSWWAAATNAGIREAMAAGCSHVLTYNDDNLTSLRVLHQLVSAADMHPGSIVAATICDLHQDDTVIFAGRKRSCLTDRFKYMNLFQSYRTIGKGLREVDLLHGKCTLFPVAVFKKNGLFDEKSFPHLFADDDLVLRAKNKGYRLLVDLDTVVFNDQTTTGLNPYDRRLGVPDIVRLFVSRRSAFQLSTRTRFLWRHRRSVFTFVLTWCVDYLRLISIVLLRWLVSDSTYRKIEQYYLRLRSA